MKIVRLMCVAAVLATMAIRVPAEDAPVVKPKAEPDALAWWGAAKAEIRAMLKDSGRTEDDLEQPAWYAMPYNTLGRMPLVDTALGKPLEAPEIALWADKQARDNCYSFEGLLRLADEMANAHKSLTKTENANPPLPKDAVEKRDQNLGLLLTLDAIPDDIGSELYMLVKGLRVARDFMVHVGEKLPDRYRDMLMDFLLPRGSGEPRFRAFTAPMGDIPDLIAAVGQEDLATVYLAALCLSVELNQCCQNLRKLMQDPEIVVNKGVLFDGEFSFGRVIIGGTGNDTYTEDAALIVDLGGDDKYFNNAGGSRPGCPVSVVIDVSGDDLYQGHDCCQGCGIGGVGILTDWSGDDDYIADIGSQSFAAFGYSVLSDAKGTDNYRIKAMGLGCATTLGVAIMADGEGDDGYRAGGYPGQGFYKDYDASFCCGAATGMREWPPTGKTTLYGGVGFFSDGAGNDRYNTYAFANGAGYMFSLGMCVDSGGNDVYTGMFYTQGCGCHMGAGVCIDRAGDDVHTGGFGGQGFHHTGAIVDRGVGILLEIGGNDIYEGGGGAGFATKPSGCAICVDTAGNDTYLSNGSNGLATMPLGDSAQSQAFFLDFGGKDNYPKPEFKDNTTWKQDDYGMGKDCELADVPARKDGWKPPEKLEGKGSVSTFERLFDFCRMWERRKPLDAFTEGVGIREAVALAESGNVHAQREVIDFVGQLNVAKQVDKKSCTELAQLFACKDRQLRMLYPWLLAQTECTNPALVRAASNHLKSETDAIVRGLTATALGVSKVDFAVEYLVPLTQDNDWFVRRRAAGALKNFPEDEKAFAALKALVETEKDFRVLTQTAVGLGATKSDASEALLKKLMAHENGFVQGEAVYQLVMTFPTTANFGEAVKRATTTDKPLRDLKVLPLLGRVSGVSMKPEEWAAWWDKNQKTFDVPKAVALAKEINDAEALYNKGKALDAVDAMRKLMAKAPDHADPKRLLISYLGEAASGAALLGLHIADAREWAEELVRLDPTSAHYELRADLEHQSFDFIAARKSLEKAIELADETAREPLRKRLQEWSKPEKKK